jgi:dipeptidyl aminopeptidase/acylaminoacyl peptidase
VVDIVHVDEARRLVYFTAVGRESGRDPYYKHLYRVALDGGEAELLSPEDADHTIKPAPSGRFFLDTYSRVDEPPVTVVRRDDGEAVCRVQEADVSLLAELGWTKTERFRVKARDGMTDICGIIMRPCNFEPGRKVPVIEDIYGGPQVNRAHPSFAHSGEKRTAAFWQAQAIAELGFIVVMIDGLGMPLRHRKYQDVAFKNLGDGGIPDHIAALRQLALRYPYMDIDRVGIYGHSAGGYASAHAILAYPDFYKVAVSTAGNHHHGLDKAVWVERYMGFPVGRHYKEQANSSLAGNLKGKLLLMHGEMDENVHVASTFELVDALIKANKDFDMVILPNRSHACTDDPYFVRKRWDYFVRHLLGGEPPSEYRISKT